MSDRSVTALCLLLVSGWLAAGETVKLERQDGDSIRPLVDRCLDEAKKIDGLPFKIDIDAGQACLFRDARDKSEIIVVPASGLSPDPDNPLLTQDRGMAVAWLFLRGLQPSLVRESDRARIVRVSAADDSSLAPAAFQVSIHRLASGEVRAELWGTGDAPLAVAEVYAPTTTGSSGIDVERAGEILSVQWRDAVIFFIPVEPTNVDSKP